MLRSYVPKIVLLAVIIFSVYPASATIINSADVNGLHTFLDQNTGFVWLDLNNFYSQSFNDMNAIATSAGFTVADEGAVKQLLATLPITNDTWANYTAIMGVAPHRALIWGDYLVQPGSATHAWSFARPSSSAWQYTNLSFANTLIENSGEPDWVDTYLADANIWAFQASAPVPEPSTFILFGAGLAGIVFLRRRMKA